MIHLVDDEHWPWSDEISDENIGSQVFVINKFETYKREQIADKCVGEEVRAVVYLGNIHSTIKAIFNLCRWREANWPSQGMEINKDSTPT